MISVADLTHDQLCAALRVAAKGIPDETAAVELLIAHEHWLHRDPFLDHVEVVIATSEGVVVDVYWDGLQHLINEGRLSDTRSEVGVLRIAVLLAAGWLGDVLTSCDRHNVHLIAAAVLTAGGAR